VAANKKDNKSTFGLSQRNQYVLVGVLGAVLVGILAFRSIGGSSADASPAPAAHVPELGQEVAAPVAVPPMPEEPAVVVPPDELLNDPFRLPDELKRKLNNQKLHGGSIEIAPAKAGPDPLIIKEAQRLKLKGIMGSAGRRVAFIDGYVLRENDTVAGFTVVKINDRSVVLKKEETQVELSLEHNRGGLQPEPELPKDLPNTEQ